MGEIEQGKETPGHIFEEIVAQLKAVDFRPGLISKAEVDCYYLTVGSQTFAWHEFYNNFLCLFISVSDTDDLDTQ